MLFGSRSCAEAQENSDLDLGMILRQPELTPQQKAVADPSAGSAAAWARGLRRPGVRRSRAGAESDHRPQLRTAQHRRLQAGRHVARHAAPSYDPDECPGSAAKRSAAASARHGAGVAGRLEGVEIIAGAIRSGAALMFYPEANVLIRLVCGPGSGTPAFKRVPVLVRAAGGAGAPGDALPLP